MGNAKTVFPMADSMVMFTSSSPDGRVRTISTPGLPVAVWPDGRWCFELNAYIHSMRFRSVSTFRKGGTIRGYIYQISQLLKFCWRKSVSLELLDDALFTEFMKELCRSTKAGRDALGDDSWHNYVIETGRRCLEFLTFVGKLHDRSNYVSGEDASIHAERRTAARGKSRSGSKIIVEFWHHHSFPSPGIVRRRNPIGIDYIARLRRAAVKASKSAFIRQRRLVMLRLLEATGARRQELARITLDDIEEAKRMSPSAALKLFNAKRSSFEPTYRLVRISYNDLDFVELYIKTARRLHIDETIGEGFDHKQLFVGHRGEPLNEETISGEMRKLRLAAGIKGRAHAHLFRHRFVTVRLMHLIRAHRISGRTEFEMKFRVDSFKMAVAEETGHRSLESLDTYIDWAFIELAGGPSDGHIVDLAQVAASVNSSFTELKALRESMRAEEFADELLVRYGALAKDIGATLERKREKGGQELHDATQ